MLVLKGNGVLQELVSLTTNHLLAQPRMIGLMDDRRDYRQEQ